MRRKLRATLKRRALTAEAALLLIAAKLALRAVPFARLARTFERPARGAELVSPERQRVIIEVRHAILRATRRLPGHYVCFPLGIAAQTMLRRRGVSTTLIYGAATLPDKGLIGHVWVMDGDEGVIGHTSADDYRVLARYESR